MKKYLRQLITVLLTAVIAVGTVFPAGMVFAAETQDNKETNSTLEEIAKQLADQTKDPFGYRTEKKASSSKNLKEAAAFPSKFDLSAKFIEDGDETPYVTPVKFQNPFGSCWGFAAIAAAETSILGDGLAPGYAAVADPENDIKQLDLSEKHVINFITKPLDDKSSSQNGEGMYYVDPNLKLTDKFDLGGNTIFATGLFASGMGPNREDRNVPEGIQEDIFAYKGLNGEIEQSKVNGKWNDYCYSAEDDWDMPEELRFKQSYMLEESFLLPSPAKNVSQSETEPVYGYEPRGTEAIKDQLLNKRAVEIGFYADTSMPNQETEGMFISKNWAHYTNTMEAPPNHAVTIVGWDDTYPKENFVEGKQPPEDGAWLVKNSWGSGEESFPNRGSADWGIPVPKTDEEGNAVLDENGEPVMVGSGYFWLSYYDQSLTTPEALKFTSEIPSEGYYLDQYDLMPVGDYTAAELDQEIMMSNVFKADEKEQLDYISCETASPDTTVEYEIYLLPPGYKNPQEGVKVASGQGGPYKYGGFHKIKVTDEVLIQKDQYYSIVLTLKTPDNKYGFNLQTGTKEEIASLFGETSWQKGVINPGESFVYFDGKWNDFSDEKFQSKVLSGMQYFVSLDNLPIKGYCKKVQNLNMYLIGENPVDLKPYEIEWTGMYQVSKNLILRFRKDKAAVMPEDPEIKWEIPAGSEGLFDLVVNEQDSSRCTLTALKPGTGYLVASCEGIGSLVVRVNIPKRGWYDVWDVGDLSYGERTLLFINDPEGTAVPFSTFTLTSDNPKVATVTAKGFVKAVGLGKTVIRARDQRGVEEIVHVRVVKGYQYLNLKGKKLTLKAAELSSGPKTIKRTKLITVKGAKGKLTFKKKSGSKLITISKKTGKITVKQGLKQGTYKIKVQVTAGATKNYRKASEIVTFKIVVK